MKNLYQPMAGISIKHDNSKTWHLAMLSPQWGKDRQSWLGSFILVYFHVDIIKSKFGATKVKDCLTYVFNTGRHLH